MANNRVTRLVLVNFDQRFTDLHDWSCGNAKLPQSRTSILPKSQSLFYLPSGPTRTQTVIWRKPWFSKREQSKPHIISSLHDVLILKVIMINRLLRDDASKGRTGTKAHTSMRDIWNTIRDPGEFSYWYQEYSYLSTSQDSSVSGFVLQ